MPIDESSLKVPQQTPADHGYAAIRAAISAIPVAGTLAVELLAMVVKPPLEKRRNVWMETVSASLIALDRDRRIDLVALAGNAQFVDAVLEATRIALRTSKTEKLHALRNAILNSALGAEPDSAIHEILLNQIDGLTSVHIEFLRWIDSGKQATTSRDGFAWTLPVLKESPLLYRMVWKDLLDRGLIAGDAPVPTKQKPTVACGITELGVRLLRFISEPGEI